MNNSFLSELRNFPKATLRKTKTEIYYLNGKTYVKNEGEQDELEIKDEKNATSCVVNNNDASKQLAIMSRQSGYVVDLTPDYSINRILDQLYLSGDDPAQNREILRENKITHIVNVTTNVENKFESELSYKRVRIYDLASENIKDYFDEVFEFIESALNASIDNRVLVHCNQGVSRSASFVIAYLLQKRAFFNYKSAYNYVREQRPQIKPNEGFVKHLIELEIKLTE